MFSTKRDAYSVGLSFKGVNMIRCLPSSNVHLRSHSFHSVDANIDL